jgi:transposase-like protein
VDVTEARRINIFNIPHAGFGSMSLEMEHGCPECGEATEFYRAASTTVHLGEKTKWRCTECDYGFVLIDGEVDSSA